MKKRLATFLLTGILLTGCHKAIVTQISSSQNVVSAVKSAIEKEFEDIAVQANQGDAEAQYSLAVMYDEGEGTREDNAKAIEWYTKSANQGYDLAQYNLAIMYDDGEGVDQDRSKAIEWFTKAANQGYAKAQLELSRTYYNYDGKGTREDYDKHIDWRTKAVNQGMVR